MARSAASDALAPSFGMPQVITLANLGTLGVIKDRPNHEVEPEAFTDGNNVRFTKRNIQRILGHVQVYGSPLGGPDWVFQVPSATQNFWLYGTKTAAYVYDGTHHTITRASGAYTAANQWDWNFSLIGGVPILNNGTDKPQYWPALSSVTDLADLANWPALTTAKMVKAFGSYLVALNIVSSGVVSQDMVWWSAKAPLGGVPATWDPSDATHDAGQIELTDVEGGEILGGDMLGNYFIIYKRMSTHVMRYIGGQDVMGFEMILATSGTLTPRSYCPIQFGSKHFVVTQDDVIQHQGYRLSAQSILEERDRNFLFTDMDATNFVSAFAFDNISQREAWFCYPSSGNVLPNKALIWNYFYNTVTFRDFNGLYADVGVILTAPGRTWNLATFPWSTDTGVWGTQGSRGVVFSSPSAGKLYRLDQGLLFDGVTPLCFVERQGLAIIGKDRQGNPLVNYDRRKLLSRVWPKVQGSSLLTIKCGAQEQINGALTWQPSQTFNPLTQKYLDFTANGRLLAYNVTSQDGNAWELQGMDLEVSDLGNQ